MLSPELKEQVVRFVHGGIAAEELEEWLVSREPAYLAQPDSADADMVAAIHLGLAEWSDGIRTMEQFRSLLLEALPKGSAPLGARGEPQTESKASSQ